MRGQLKKELRVKKGNKPGARHRRKMPRHRDRRNTKALPSNGAPAYDPNARPIEDIITEIMADVPKEEWANVPKDLAENLDHYLYGAPRK